MPELPDVEVFKQYADATSLHQEIEKTVATDEKVFETSPQKVQRALKGKKLEETKRIGKYLFLRFDAEQWLCLHFGMTGRLNYFKHEEEVDTEHAKLILHFTNGYQLAYICPRTFGKIWLTDDPEAFAEAHSLGPDALALSLEQFKSILADKRGGIKSALMDQEEMAGIGNVYSDEILFQSGIHPKAKVQSLSEAQVETLYKKMRSVLKTTIEKGAQPDQLPDYFLLRHRDEGADCPGGKGKVEKIKVSGRSCYCCPEQQKL